MLSKKTKQQIAERDTEYDRKQYYILFIHKYVLKN